MSIRKDLVIKVSNGLASLNMPLRIYEKDHGIELRFKLMDYKYKYDKDPDNILNSSKEDILEAYTTIVNPSGYELTQINGEVIDDTVKFMIEDSYTDELEELGIYRLQIHVKCEHSEFSIPPVEFEVLERLKGNLERNSDEVGRAAVDISYLQTDEGSFMSEDGTLNIVWRVGDIISSTKLNEMVTYINEHAVINIEDDIIDRITIPGVNRFNIDNFMPKIFADPRNGELVYKDNDNYYTIKLEVKPNTTYKYAYLNTNKDAYLPVNGGFLSFLDANEKLLSYISGSENWNGIISTPDNCYFVVHTLYSNFDKEAMNERKPMCVEDYVFNTFDDMMACYIPYAPYQLDPSVISTNFFKETNLVVNHAVENKKSHWQNMTGVTYGDSITAINNPDCSNGGYTGDEYYASWGSYIIQELGLSKLYGRGIGGQKYSWGDNGGSVSFINADGSLNSRNDNYNYNNYQGEIPSDTVKSRGCLASWLRITTQIPESIRDEIDFIFIMGGTNDIAANIPIGDSEYIEGDTTDPEWVNSDYYIGGDFDLTTYIGGLCSTVMKMQLWCPNATIIIGTPLSGRDNGKSTPSFFVNSLGKEYIEYVKATLDATQRYSIPCIDVYGNTGINPFNRKDYIADGVHPYKDKGTKALARAVIGGMLGIYKI